METVAMQTKWSAKSKRLCSLLKSFKLNLSVLSSCVIHNLARTYCQDVSELIPEIHLAQHWQHNSILIHNIVGDNCKVCVALQRWRLDLCESMNALEDVQRRRERGRERERDIQSQEIQETNSLSFTIIQVLRSKSTLKTVLMKMIKMAAMLRQAIQGKPALARQSQVTGTGQQSSACYKDCNSGEMNKCNYLAKRRTMTEAERAQCIIFVLIHS